MEELANGIVARIVANFKKMTVAASELNAVMLREYWRRDTLMKERF